MLTARFMAANVQDEGSQPPDTGESIFNPPSTISNHQRIDIKDLKI